MRTVKLGEIAVIERDLVQSSEIVDGENYVGLETIQKGGGLGIPPRVMSGELSSAKFRFTCDHVLYGKLRPYLAKIALPEFHGICSTDILPIRPTGAVDRRYLAQYLRRPDVVNQVNSLATGANLPRVNPKALETVRVPLPDVRAQRRIADILDKADMLRAKRREAIAHLDTLAQSIFHDMFGGWTAAATVDGIAASEKSSIRTGPFGSQLLHDEFVDSGVAVLGLDNVVGNEFRWGRRRYITAEKYKQLERYTVHSGDVLISIMGTTGRCVVVPSGVPKAINTKHICAITVDQAKILPSFLRGAFLWHPESRTHLVRQTKGAIMSGLNMGIIKSMPLPLPSLREQQEFSRKVESVDRMKDCLRKAQEVDHRLFSSLQERAFKGEL